MNELNIDIICANSPQTKGRVERANRTLQDRLVKELRLRGIGDMAAGHAYLPEFQADHNRRKRTIRHAGRVVSHRAHAKDEARISQGAIVENKRLGVALGWIAERQRERDAQQLARPKITLRNRKRIRAAAGLTA